MVPPCELRSCRSHSRIGEQLESIAFGKPKETVEQLPAKSPVEEAMDNMTTDDLMRCGIASRTGRALASCLPGGS